MSGGFYDEKVPILWEELRTREKMVFKRVLAEFTKEERKSKFCGALIEGKIISNYVFPWTKHTCGGCGQVGICHCV
jgi:hypothetical protein